MASSAGWKMRLKQRFWYSVRNLSVMAVKLIDCRSLTIAQHRFGACGNSPPGLPFNYLKSIRLGRLPNNPLVTDACFSPQE